MALTEKITLDASQATQQLDKLKQKTQSTAQSVAQAGQQMSSGMSGISSVAIQAMNGMGIAGMAIAAVFMIVTAGINAAVKGTISFARKLDGLAKQAKSMDMGINEFMGLRHACNLAGADLEKVMNIINRVEQAATNAVDGNKKYQDSFHEIGLSWLEMSKMSPEQKIMAVVAAVRRLKEEGKSLPASFVDQLVGRKGVQTVNKLAADPNFERNVIGAELEGFGFDPKMIAQAESLNDAVSNVGDAFTVWVSKLTAVKWMMENLESLSNELAQGFAGTSPYKVDPKYRGQAIGIGDVADETLSKNGFSKEQMKDAISSWAAYEDSHAQTNMRDDRVDYRTPLEKLGIDFNQMSDADIKAKFDEIFGKTVDNMSEYNRQIIFRLTSENNKQFDYKDRKTWIRLKKKGFDQGTLTRENATDELVQNIENMDVSKMKELYDCTEDILDVEDLLGQKLTKQQRTLIEQTAEMRNQEIIAQNIADIQKKIQAKAQSNLEATSAKGVLAGYDLASDRPLSNQRPTRQILSHEDYLKKAGYSDVNIDRYKKYTKAEQDLFMNDIDSWRALSKSKYGGNLTEDEKNKVNAFYASSGFNASDVKQFSTMFSQAQSMMYQDVKYNARTYDIATAQKELDLIERKNLLIQAGLEPTQENLNLYKQQLDVLQDIEKKQKSVNLLTSMQNDSIDFGFDLMEATGNTYGARKGRNRWNAQKTKGDYLTQDELNMVDQQTEMQSLLEYIKSFKMEDNAVHTNELAQRGGFTGSVVVEPNDNQRKQVELLQAIKRAAELNANHSDRIKQALAGY